MLPYSAVEVNCRRDSMEGVTAASRCSTSVVIASKSLLRLEHQDARAGLGIFRSPPLLRSRSPFPLLPHRRRRCLFTVAPRDSNPQQKQQQQELDVSVLRFTFGIPGLDESYLPRYIGIVFGTLIVLNHVLSASPPTPALLRTEALGICLSAFSIALPYLGRFLEGANAMGRTSLPEGNRQIFLMTNNISESQKEDLAWASYVLLRNTNSMSVIIAVNGVLCVRGYWDVPEVKNESRDQLLKWFNTQIQQTGFFDLKDTLYFPQSSDSEFGILLPKGTLSMVLQPMVRASDSIAKFSVKNEGFVFLASNVRYAYAQKDRAWIRAIANKFLHANGVKNIQGLVTSQ